MTSLREQIEKKAYKTNSLMHNLKYPDDYRIRVHDVLALLDKFHEENVVVPTKELQRKKDQGEQELEELQQNLEEINEQVTPLAHAICRESIKYISGYIQAIEELLKK